MGIPFSESVDLPRVDTTAELTAANSHPEGRIAWVSDVDKIYASNGAMWAEIAAQSGQLPSSTVAALPAAGVAGRLAQVTDGIRGVWIDTGTQWHSLTGYADVKDFGATGNGVTDDTAAIQAAIDVFKGSNSFGGTVFFPPGTYRITSTLNISVGGTNATSHFSLRLLGGGTPAGVGSAGVSAIKGTSRIYADGAVIAFTVGNTTLTEFNGPSFENLVIVDNNGTATGGISLTNVDRWKVSGCTFWNFQTGYGMFLTHTGSVPDGLIEDTWFVRCQTGILLRRSDFLKVVNTSFHAQISGAVAVQAGYRGIVADPSASNNLDTLRLTNVAFRMYETPLDFSAMNLGSNQEIAHCRFEVFTTAIKLSANSKDVWIMGGDFNNAAVGVSGTALDIPAGALRTRAFLGECASVTTVCNDLGTDTVVMAWSGFSSTEPGMFTLPATMMLRQGVLTLAGNQTLASERWVNVDATGASRTVTLPDVNSVNRFQTGSRRGQAYTIKKLDSSANTVTITRTSAQPIDGSAADLVLRKQGEWVSLVSAVHTGGITGWLVVGRGIQDFTRNSATELALTDGDNLAFGTVTGTKIGTAANQKVGAYGATAIVQPSGTPANATDLATAITLVNDIKAKLIALGWIA